MFTLRQTMLGILFGAVLMPAALAQDYLGTKPYYGVHYDAETGAPIGGVVERRARQNGTGIVEYDYRDIHPQIVEQQTIVDPGVTKNETVTQKIMVKKPVIASRNFIAYKPVKWRKVVMHRAVVVKKGVWATQTSTKTVTQQPTMVQHSVLVRPVAGPSFSIIDKPLIPRPLD